MGHGQIIQRLLEKADVNAQGENDGTALQAASAHGNSGLVQRLLKLQTASAMLDNPVHPAAALGWGRRQRADSGGMVRHCAPGGFSQRTMCRGGKYGTALQAASASGHDRIVQRLLEEGADVNAQGG